jgi:hypothetical protein
MKSDDFFGARALDVAIEAGRRAGIDTAGAQIFRVQSSIHVEFPRAQALARIESPGRVGIAQRQVLAARAWARVGAPVVPLVRSELQPFVFGDESVTLWRLLQHNGKINLGELGRTTRALHSASRDISVDEFPALDALADVRPWIRRSAEWLNPEDRNQLADRLEVLSAWWNSYSSDDPLGTILVHGDLHRANALNTEDGIVLIDVEDAGVGPAGWDLVPLAVGVRRYGDSAEEFERFIKGYGINPRTWSGHEMMCQVYELEVTIWALHCSDVKPGMVGEAQIRVDGILGRSRTRWTMC